MTPSIKKRLDSEIARHESTLEQLAEERIDLFEKEWRRTRKSPIELIFGMGYFDVRIDGKLTDKYGNYGNGFPKILMQLDEDLDEITNQYRSACPAGRTINP